VSEIGYQVSRFRLGAVIAVAVAAGFLVWLLVIRDTGSSGVAAGGGPVAASQEDLTALQDKLGHPIYWAGEQSDKQLELTETEDGKVYVRYLDPGTEIGEPKAAFLTVATYPLQNGFDALQKVSKRPGASVAHVDNGGLVVSNRDAPNSVYLAYPDQKLQVEVYDPNPGAGLELVKSGAVVPVG
jgi:hypothetical protein